MQGRQKNPPEISVELAANAKHNRQLPLFSADHNVRKQNVYPHVAIGMLGLYARTCQQAEAETAFLRLLPAAIDAEPVSYNQKDETRLAAIAILKRHTELLFVKGMVTDHFGRKIFASPYQLFHSAGDVWALKQIHAEIIPKIENGEARAQEQFQQQFPNCKLPFDPEMGEAALYDDRNNEMIAQVIVQLEIIREAITADPCTHGLATRPETTGAVAELCQLFAPKEEEVIRTGLHFPLAIMREISRVYDVIPPGAKASFFSREVIGAALDALSAVDGQCCKYGLSKLNNEIGPDRRDGLFCRHPKGIPPELAPLSGKLGRAMFVDPYDGESCFQSSQAGRFDWYNKNGRRAEIVFYFLRAWTGRSFDVGWQRLACMFGELCRAKNFSLGELMRPRREEKTSRCVIC
jgi:hypothetical protein